MDFRHSHDIGHFDLTGTNVMVDQSRTLKVIDFGMAEIDSGPLTVLKESTAHYLAPEIMRINRRMEAAPGYGLAADLWSFGCTTGIQARCHLQTKKACLLIFTMWYYMILQAFPPTRTLRKMISKPLSNHCCVASRQIGLLFKAFQAALSCIDRPCEARLLPHACRREESGFRQRS